MTAGVFIGLVVLGGGFFGLDQWTKKAVGVHLAGRSIGWGPVLRLRTVTHVEDSYRRTSFRVALVIVWCAAVASAIVLYRLNAWFHNPVAGSGLALALGGAAGNLTDILHRRSIVNFIEVGWWPVFNLADIGIVAGVVTAFLTRV
jgi:signal peptidase II